MRNVLVSAFLLLTPACSPSESRSVEYFEAHLDEARALAAACAKGSSRGTECDNAAVAVKAAENRERFDRFRGK